MSRCFPLAALLALSLAACGGSSAAPASSAPAKPASSASAAAPASGGGDRTANLQALYAKAKTEGEVVFKGGLEDYVKQDLAAAFTQDYPGIKVTHAVVPNGQVPPQIITEATANKISTDVGFGNVNDVIPLDERGILLQYDWNSLIDATNQTDFDNKMIHMYDTASILAYNTDLLKGNDVPKTWDDLLNPRFSGKMAFTSEVGSIFGGADQERGEDATLAFLEKLKAQKPVFTQKGAEAAQQLAAGQLSVATMPISQYMDMQSKKAPVGMTAVGPFTVRHLDVYTVKGAPHPNAALLFMAWAASDKSHQIMGKTARDQVTPCTASTAAKTVCDAGVKLIVLDTLDKIKAENAFQQKAQKALGITPG